MSEIEEFTVNFPKNINGELKWVPTTFKRYRDQPHMIELSSLLEAFHGKEVAPRGAEVLLKHSPPFVHISTQAWPCISNANALRAMYPDNPAMSNFSTNSNLNTFIYTAKLGTNLALVLYPERFPLKIQAPFYYEVKHLIKESLEDYEEMMNESQRESHFNNLKVLFEKAHGKARAKRQRIN